MDPRPAPEAYATITLSTPLTTLGMLTYVLRQRFLAANQLTPVLPWSWSDDLENTAIFIESGWNKEIEARTVRPGVWVDQMQTVYQRSGVGHQDQISVNLQAGLEMFHIFGSMDVSIDCTSPNHGESLLLGSIVQDFIQMSTFLIQKWFGLREISEVILNRTSPFEHDDKLWTTQVQFRVGYQTRWASMQIRPMLHQIGLTLEALESNPEEIRRILLQNPYGG